MPLPITVSGASITRNIQALDDTQGFVVRVTGSVNFKEDRNASIEAQNRGLVGQLINGHEPGFAAAQTLAGTAETAFVSKLTEFVTDWNTDPVGPQGLKEAYR